MCVVDLEVVLDDGTLGLALAPDRREQVLGVDLVLDLLVAVGVGVRSRTWRIRMLGACKENELSWGVTFEKGLWLVVDFRCILTRINLFRMLQTKHAKNQGIV